MQQIPKIVRERLKATSVTHHPDADVLTAFAEKSLRELERGVVLEHLARCGECRDVVALALPEIEVAMPAVRVHRGWLTWPVLRWGFVAAGTVAIAWFGTLQYQRRLQPTATVARQQAPEAALYVAKQSAPSKTTALPTAPIEKHEQAPARSESSGTAASAPRMTTELIQQKSAAPARIVHAPTPSSQFASGAGAGIGGTMVRGPKGPIQQWQQQSLPRVQAPTSAAPSAAMKQQMADMASNMRTPPPSQNETVEVSGAAPVTEPQSAEVQVAQAGPESDSDRVGKAKEPVKVETEAAAPLQNTIDASPQDLPVERNGSTYGRNFTQLAAQVPMPRWTISSTGSLQRSFDQGTTWQQVDVNASFAPSANLTSLDVVAKTARAKQQEADKKKPTAPPTVIFRAVAAIGPEVWAGGTNRALYHSLDAGNHWTRILPGSAAGAILTGDIVSLQFADVQHGKILTSTAETWTTSDDGQTWQKQ